MDLLIYQIMTINVVLLLLKVIRRNWYTMQHLTYFLQ
nr:MAG TPA: hypothetical protein [Bacteriophage sp.]